MKLIALKPLRYKTRRLLAGDEFEAPERDAKVLIAVKRARDPADRRPGKLPPPPPEIVAAVPEVAAEPLEMEAAPAGQAEHAEPEAAAIAEHPEPLDPDAEKDRLRAEAEALDIDVDGRWGVARLHEEIATARAKAATS